MIKVLQVNKNRSRPALDLLLHHAREMGAWGWITEPNYIPAVPGWFASRDGGAAVYCDTRLTEMQVKLANQGIKHVAVFCGTYMFISVYISPSLGLHEFNKSLDELSDTVGSRSEKIVLGGDFNAKARLWGSRVTDSRGFLLVS